MAGYNLRLASSPTKLSVPLPTPRPYCESSPNGTFFQRFRPAPPLLLPSIPFLKPLNPQPPSRGTQCARAHMPCPPFPPNPHNVNAKGCLALIHTMQARWPAKTPAEHAAALARVAASQPTDIAAFAGGALPHTILSCCHGTLLDMFNTRTVLPLRAACRDAAAAVAAHPWDDLETVILGNVGPALSPPGPSAQRGAWRGCFPRAKGASVSGKLSRRAPLQDADFVHFAGLRRLSMARCRAVTDAAFASLAGIQSLDMSECSQAAITDAAFAPLVGIKSLNMSGCSQATITDAAFVPLAGIQSLEMEGCNQATITDAAFATLAGIQSLNMWGCTQPTITDGAFAPLVGVKSLSVSFCSQGTITDAAFAPLAGIHSLDMSGCNQATITDAAFVPLAGIGSLSMRWCQASITGAAFAPLAGIRQLDMRSSAPGLIAAARAAGLPVIG